jgi:hypothetical protein
MNLNMDNETQGKITGDEESMVLHATHLQTGEHPLGLAGTYNAIRRLNRNTTWIAIGLLAPVVFAVLMVAVQGPRPTADDLTEQAKQTTGDPLPSANAAAISKVVGSEEKSTEKITSEQTTSVDRHLIPETNQPAAQAHASSWSPTKRPGPATVIHTKTPKTRIWSSGHPRYIDVKTRLLALWHQGFRCEKSPGWTLFSNSNIMAKKERQLHRHDKPLMGTVRRSNFG